MRSKNNTKKKEEILIVYIFSTVFVIVVVTLVFIYPRSTHKISFIDVKLQMYWRLDGLQIVIKQCQRQAKINGFTQQRLWKFSWKISDASNGTHEFNLFVFMSWRLIQSSLLTLFTATWQPESQFVIKNVITCSAIRALSQNPVVQIVKVRLNVTMFDPTSWFRSWSHMEKPSQRW